jgi:Protein of unknown function (DUF1559)
MSLVIHKRSGLTRIKLVLIVAVVAIAIGLLIPLIPRVRMDDARMQTINNLKQLGTATKNYAGTYSGKMPANGTVHARYASVFGHLLPFVEMDLVYRRVETVLNLKVGVPLIVTNASETNDTPDYRTAVIAPYTSPADPTTAALTGLGADGYGTASFASNGYLFNPGSFADGTTFTLVAPTNPPIPYVVQNPIPAGPRLPGSFANGTASVVLFATRYATCGPDAQDNWWASPRRTYFDNSYPQTLPAQGTTAARSEVLCNPSAVQGFRSTGPLLCMGDHSVRSVNPGVSATVWNLAVSPGATATLAANWYE